MCYICALIIGQKIVTEVTFASVLGLEMHLRRLTVEDNSNLSCKQLKKVSLTLHNLCC